MSASVNLESVKSLGDVRFADGTLNERALTYALLRHTHPDLIWDSRNDFAEWDRSIATTVLLNRFHKPSLYTSKVSLTVFARTNSQFVLLIWVNSWVSRIELSRECRWNKCWLIVEMRVRIINSLQTIGWLCWNKFCSVKLVEHFGNKFNCQLGNWAWWIIAGGIAWNIYSTNQPLQSCVFFLLDYKSTEIAVELFCSFVRTERSFFISILFVIENDTTIRNKMIVFL